MVSKTHGWTKLGEGWYRNARDPNILVNLWEFDPTEINGKGRHVSEMESRERADEGYVVTWSSPTTVNAIARYETKTEALDDVPNILKQLDEHGIDSFDNLAEQLGVRGVDITGQTE